MSKLKKALGLYTATAIARSLSDDVRLVLCTPAIAIAFVRKGLRKAVTDLQDRWGWKGENDVPETYYEIGLHTDFMPEDDHGGSKCGTVSPLHLAESLYYWGELSPPKRMGLLRFLVNTDLALSVASNRYIEFVDYYYIKARDGYGAARRKLLGSILK